VQRNIQKYSHDVIIRIAENNWMLEHTIEVAWLSVTPGTTRGYRIDEYQTK
jgi:hypothetical protein